MSNKEKVLTCAYHPNLRWACPDIAWSGYYNGIKDIVFIGTLDKKCGCDTSNLILAPEDNSMK